MIVNRDKFIVDFNILLYKECHPLKALKNI
jgi:hypothetical protein